MGGMCCVSVRIIQHRIERSRKWRNSGKSRKDRPISNFGIEHEHVFMHQGGTQQGRINGAADGLYLGHADKNLP